MTTTGASPENKNHTFVPFLESAPRIDGCMDSSIMGFEDKALPVCLKSDSANPNISVRYRLAYGTHFFYLFISVRDSVLFTRDRAYQNGDGFNLVLGRTKPEGRRTDEFYVLAASALQQENHISGRHFFWYYNVHTLFKPTGEDTRLAVIKQNDHINFELLLPWSEVYPYHPWLKDSLGFNLRVVKGVKNGGANFYFALPDQRLDSENSTRAYIPLCFEEPLLKNGFQTYARLHRNHIQSGDTITVEAVTLNAAHSENRILTILYSGEGQPLHKNRWKLAGNSGVHRQILHWTVPNLNPGGYQLHWKAPAQSGSGRCGLSVLAPFSEKTYLNRLKEVKSVLSAGSRQTLQFMIHEHAEARQSLKPYETAAQIRMSDERLNRLFKAAGEGVDRLANQNGFVRKAYCSAVDSTLQPYVLFLPHDYHRNKSYPLMIYLHGSGTDESNIMNDAARRLIPEGFLALAPYGRGTSNCFSWNHAQDDIREALNAVIREYSVDTTRILLSGFSMGGYGVYRSYFEQPRRFHAIAVFSGHPNLANRWSGGEQHPDFLDQTFLNEFARLPVFIFHGKQDRNTPFHLTEQLVHRLKAVGARVTFVTEDKAGHTSPSETSLQRYYRWIKTHFNNAQSHR